MAEDDISGRMRPTIQALASVTINADVDEGNINLADGENSLMQDMMIDVCKDAMAKSITTEVFSNPQGLVGNPIATDALAQFINQYFNPSIRINSDHIVPTAGSSNALQALLLTLCDPGDSVLCPAPAWRGHSLLAYMNAAVNVIPAYVPATHEWLNKSLSEDLIPALEQAFLSAPEPNRIKALLIANPSNPLVQCYPPNVVQEMMDFCHKHNLHYISDEVFANTVYDPSADQFVSALSLLNPAGTKDKAPVKSYSNLEPKKTHIVWSMTKDIGACGVRSGCVITYNPNVKAGVSYGAFWQMSSLTALFTASVLNSPSLPLWLSSTKNSLLSNYRLCRVVLSTPELERRVQILPATAGLWINIIITLKDGEEFSDFLSKTKANGVEILPAQDFKRFILENQNEVKLTIAKPENVLREGLERLKRSLV